MYTILLADDDPDDRDLFQEAAAFLEPGIKIRSFKDGVELMTFMLGSPIRFDVVFLDLNMPRKNGIECLQEIARHPEFDNVPIIIYTTSLNPIDIESTYAAGAFRFFKKPNSFDELKDILSLAFHCALDHNRSRSKETFVLTGKE